MDAAVVRRDYFEALADGLCAPCPGVDRTTLLLNSEASDFVRFNRAAVREATQVEQAVATLGVVRGARHIGSRLSLSGDAAADIALLRGERRTLIAALDELADDPYLLLPDAATHSERHDTGALPDVAPLVAAVARCAGTLDFVGFYAGGPVVRAFADSLGSRHWHHIEGFQFEWCLYLAGDKAVKCRYGGRQWNEEEFARRVAEGAQRLQWLALPPRTLPPGEYRAWLAPAATAELLGTLAWSGFGARARRIGTSSLMRLAHRDAVLHPDVFLAEHTAAGIAPAFTPEGFARPPRVGLVEAGLAADMLTSARSAREYGLVGNGANADETPESLALAPGRLPDAEVLAALGTGLWVSNLWYLNYSDQPACRITGMTRFACLWVENGRPVAPLAVMRFDDSFLRLFGPGLVALGERCELLTDGDTYGERQLGSISTPGALVQGWRLTL